MKKKIDFEKGKFGAATVIGCGSEIVISIGTTANAIAGNNMSHNLICADFIYFKLNQR